MSLNRKRVHVAAPSASQHIAPKAPMSVLTATAPLGRRANPIESAVRVCASAPSRVNVSVNAAAAARTGSRSVSVNSGRSDESSRCDAGLSRLVAAAATRRRTPRRFPGASRAE